MKIAPDMYFGLSTHVGQITSSKITITMTTMWTKIRQINNLLKMLFNLGLDRTIIATKFATIPTDPRLHCSIPSTQNEIVCNISISLILNRFSTHCHCIDGLVLLDSNIMPDFASWDLLCKSATDSNISPSS